MIFRVLARKFSTTHAGGMVAEKLTNRGLLRIRGQNVPGFLQGIVTADVLDFVNRDVSETADAQRQHHAAVYSHVLNVKGRVMYDLFVYRDPKCPRFEEEAESSLLVEADVDALPRLAALVKMYKVKRKIEIERSEEYEVWNVHRGDMAVPEGELVEASSENGTVVARDPRLPQLGW